MTQQFTEKNLLYPLKQRLTAMRQIWPLAVACLTTKHERILISYKFFHIKVKTHFGSI